MREARTRSKYGLGRDSGVAREMIGRIESGRTVPTLFVVARLAFTLGMTLTEFVQGLDGGALA